MHTTFSIKHARRLAAAFCAIALAGSLAACGSSTDGKDDAKDADSSSSNSSLKDLTQIAGVTLTSKVGEKPQVAFKTPLTVTNNSYVVLQKGNGDVIETDDRVCAQAVFINAKDGTELASTWEDNVPDCSLNLADDNVTDAYRELLGGQKLNATVAIGINDSNSSGTSYLSVLTLVSKSKDYDRATGETVADVPADLPKVTLGKDGKPSIDMNGYQAGDQLVAQTLIKGSGKEVTDQNTVKVKYTGWLLDGTQFDSSWDRGDTLEADTYSGGSHTVITGWQQGMVGQTVGSQVLLAIPPDLAYGDTDNGTIPANSTLVFVVDILAAY